VCSDHQIVWIKKDIEFVSKIIYSEDLYVHFIHEQRPEPVDIRLHTGLAIPREACPLTHNVMFHKYSFLLQRSKLVIVNL
jgi:hypothetical protein